MVEIVQPFVPLMSQERFAELVGLSEATIRGMIQSGYLPAFKMGKRRMVNVAAVTRLVMKNLEDFEMGEQD